MSKPATRRKKREPAPPRKKACEQCTVAKVSCSLGRPVCRRCQSRELSCKYLTLTGLEDPPRSISNRADAPEFELSIAPGGDLFSSATPVEDLFFDQETGQSPPRQEVQSDSAEFREQRKKATGNPTDFSHIDLISVTDSESIRNRWLQSFLPSTGQRAKILPPHTVQYLSCVFRSYSRQLLRPGCFPPFIHPLQMVDGELPLPLANCFSLVRMWVAREHGSDVLITETVKSEMQRLFDGHKAYPQLDLLAAFQAYLLYATTAFFLPLYPAKTSDDKTPLIVDYTTLSTLQEFAYSLSLSGLLCTAETTHTRPDWASWIIASAKRRALYAMYLFDNVFNALSHVPTFIAEELAQLPVPASKALWEAGSRSVWEREYGRHLVEWEGGELRIEELWFATGQDEGRRRERVERWVEGVDEFGMMLFAVCAHIHGC